MSNKVLKKKIKRQWIYLRVAVAVGMILVVANILFQ